MKRMKRMKMIIRIKKMKMNMKMKIDEMDGVKFKRRSIYCFDFV
jgi:hypothetical protein